MATTDSTIKNAKSGDTPGAGKSTAGTGITAPEDDPAVMKGALVGKVRGLDLDPTIHVYDFTDPVTGEPVEWHQVVHEVPVGVSSDGKLETAPMTDFFAKGEDIKAAAGKPAPGANVDDPEHRESKDDKAKDDKAKPASGVQATTR